MFFQFEDDFVESLRCIPMVVRYKLDTCGVKLKLNHWNQLAQDERLTLVELPCETETEIQAYRSFIHSVVEKHGSDRPSDLPIAAHPEWRDATTIPDSVAEKARSLDQPITLEQWQALAPLQRFALIKLSRSNHENKNFLPALKEFHLI
ncbi:MAG TPA: nitrate reductase associated protein [Crinalium sp.]|jgi:hypothetical protein